MPADSSRAVFLSYASQDADAVRCICDALRGAGVEVWFDQSELVGGDAWDQKIRNQIKECALFIPVISANMQARREGYFRLEWKLAAQRTHMISDRQAFLLPIVIDETRDTTADVPEEFRAVQWSRLRQGYGEQARFAPVRSDPDAAAADSRRAAYMTFDLPRAERCVRRAIELNPRLAIAHDQYAWILAALGRMEEARPESVRMLELEPLSALMSNDRGWMLYFSRRYDDAIAQGRRALELDANYANGHCLIGWALVQQGRAAETLAEFEKGKAQDPQPYWEGAMGGAYGAMGQRAKAEKVLREVEAMAQRRYVLPSVYFSIYHWLGENEKALDWLERCYEERDSLTLNIPANPTFERPGLQTEPRVGSLTKKVRAGP